MADMFPVAGAEIYIGGSMSVPTSDVTESSFSAVSWTLIDGWSTMGAIGDKAALITTPIINRGRDTKQKGTRNAGSMANKFAVIADDAGQLAVIAAEATALNYPFKIVFDDAPSGGTPTTKYFIGLVTDASEDGGNANTVRLMNGTIEVNTNVVTVEAAA
jgi:hypothetical protein